MKGTDIALLAGVGIVGYGLLNSNLFKGVGGGVGDAVGGLGQGVGYAGQSVGYNLGEVFNAVGQLGQSSQTLIRETGTQSTNIVRETGEGVTGILDEAGRSLTETTGYVGDVFEDTGGVLSDATGSIRSVNKGFWGAFDDTWNLDNPKNIFTNTAAGIGNAFSWVKKQVTPSKSIRAPSITGAVVAPTSSPSSNTSASSSSSGGSSSGGSIRTGTISTPQRNTFLEAVGYTGQSTATGIKYTAPVSSIRKPVVVAPVKRWWNPFD